MSQTAHGTDFSQDPEAVLKATLILVEKCHNAVKHAPFYVMLFDYNGRFLDTNLYAVEKLGVNPVGKTLFDLFPEDIASQRLERIRKVIETKRAITVQEKRGHDYFLSNYVPTEIVGETFCTVIASNISEVIRVKNLLSVASELNALSPIGLEEEEFCKSVAELLCKIDDVVGVEISLNGSKTVCGEVDRKYSYHIPLHACLNSVGKAKIWSDRELTETETVVIQDLVREVAVKAELYDLRRKLEKLVAQMAYIVDGVKNAVTVIKLYEELHSDGTIPREEWEKVLKAQSDKILDRISNLEDGWKTAENVLLALGLRGGDFRAKC